MNFITMQDRQKSFIVMIFMHCFNIAICSKDFDLVTEPLLKNIASNEENLFIPTTESIVVSEDEEGSGSFDYNSFGRNNVKETTLRIETALGRHDYNTIGTKSLYDDTIHTKPKSIEETGRDQKNSQIWLIISLVCVLSIGLITGIVLASIVLLQIFKRNLGNNSNFSKNINIPTTNQDEENPQSVGISKHSKWASFPSNY